MNTKYNNEELIYSLPDYISNKLTDTDLKNAIEKKINTDPDFKMEFLNLTDTMDQFTTGISEMPSDTYFNNLSVRINEAIHQETRSLAFFERFGYIFKFALPVMAVLLLITTVFIYMNSSDKGDKNALTTNENSIENKKTENDNILTENEIPDKSDTNYQNSEEITGDSGSNKTKERFSDLKQSSNYNSDLIRTEKSFLFTDVDRTVFSRDLEPSSGSVQAKATDNLAFADNSNLNSDKSSESGIPENTDAEQEFDILINGDSDEDFLEEDLFQLTPEEQSEIVEFLKQS